MKNVTTAVAALAMFLLPGIVLAAAPADLVKRLADEKTSAKALEELVKLKDAAVPFLIGEAIEGKDITARGWAVVGLSEIGGKTASDALLKLQDDGNMPMLVRTWAAAGRISLAKDATELLALNPLANSFPAVKRPLSQRLMQLLTSGNASAESLIAASIGNYELQAILVEPILALGIDALTKAMATSKDQNVRMQAAGYLGTLAQRQGKAGNELVGDAVAKAYAFDKNAKDVPWGDGPLYVPNIGWDKTFARKLTRNLVTWAVWCDKKGRKADVTKINHNMNSLALGGVLGYQADFNDHDAKYWLATWGRAVGKNEALKVLETAGLDDDNEYRKIVNAL